MNKKLLGIAILILLAATIAAGFYLFNLKKPVTAPAEQAKEFKVETTELEGSQSALFPEDLYIEDGSLLLQNYESKTSEGGMQGTIITTTNKTLVEAVSDYVEYFESKNWIEIESLFQNTEQNVIAVLRYGDERVTIIGRANPETDGNTVEVTITTLASKQK